MLNKLLTTTALVTLLTSTAIADNHTTLDANADVNTTVESTVGTDDANATTNTELNAEGNVTVDADGVMDDAKKATDEAKDKVDTLVTNSVNAANQAASSTKLMANEVAVTMSGQAVLASNLLGKQVYTSTDAEAEVVGDINDVVMDANGNAEWVIVGVGGFLGMGEKEVAISIEQIDWVERDGERVVITSITKADLEAAAEFDRDALLEDEKYTEDNFSWTDEGQKRLELLKTWDWEHAELETVAFADISAEKLIGTRVYGPDRDDLGEVGDVLMSEQGEVTAYIVDVGGFLGLGEKPVALDPSRIHIYQNAEGDLSVRSDFTQEELENGPTYSEAEYKANAEAVIIK
jgi:sporulation protein YlmC with PRC-barrel domain